MITQTNPILDLETVFEDTRNYYLRMELRDAFKKKTPYGGTLSQLGGGRGKKTFEMSLLKIPFY